MVVVAGNLRGRNIAVVFMGKTLSLIELREFLGLTARETGRLLARNWLRPVFRRAGRPYFSAEDAIAVGRRLASSPSILDRRDVLAVAHAVLRLQAGAAGMAQIHKDYRPQYAQFFEEWRAAAEGSASDREVFFTRWEKTMTRAGDEDFAFADRCIARLSELEVHVLTAWFAAASCPRFEATPLLEAGRRRYEAALSLAGLSPLLVTEWKRFASDFYGWRSALRGTEGTDIPRDLRIQAGRESAKRAAAFKTPPFRDDVAHYAGLSRMHTYRILKRIEAKNNPKSGTRKRPAAAKDAAKEEGVTCPGCGAVAGEEVSSCPECGRLL